MSSNKDTDEIIKESHNAIEKIFKDIAKSSNTKQLVIGTVSGWVTGYIGMKLGKIAAVGLGSGIIILHLANQNGYIDINWDKFHKETDKVSDKIAQETSRRSAFFDKVINFMKNNTYYSAGFTGGVLFGIASS